jgi:hypothetical protein
LSASSTPVRRAARRWAAAAAGHAPVLVDAYRLARRPRWELDVARDLAHTRRQSAFVAGLPTGETGGPTALVGLYRDNIYETKLGLVLATALRTRGLQPVALIPTSRAHRVRRYARAYDIARVIAADRFRLSTAEEEEWHTTRNKLIGGGIDFDTVKEWAFRSLPIGAHVLSTLIRSTFDGSPDLGIAENRTRLVAILSDVLVNAIRADHVLSEVEPRLVLVDEANYSVNGPLVDAAVARGIDVIQTIGIWREDALMSKRLTSANRRADAKSVAPETLTTMEGTAWTAGDQAALDHDFVDRYDGRWQLGQQFQPGTETWTRERIVGELGLDPGRPTAVVFAHVLWDASLFFGVDLFANYSDWLVQTVRAANANPRVNWVVKAHPSNVFRARHGDTAAGSSEVALLRSQFPELPDHVKLLLPDTTLSTLSLYRFADYGVTVRGTPGMEMACFGKPVFTAGTGTYAGLGFTYDSETIDEYLGRLARINEHGPPCSVMTQRARRYAHTLLLRRPWVTRSFELTFDFPERGWHPLDRNVEWTIDSIAAMESAGDLSRWASWALDSTDADYLDGMAPPL